MNISRLLLYGLLLSLTIFPLAQAGKKNRKKNRKYEHGDEEPKDGEPKDGKPKDEGPKDGFMDKANKDIKNGPTGGPVFGPTAGQLGGGMGSPLGGFGSNLYPTLGGPPPSSLATQSNGVNSGKPLPTPTSSKPSAASTATSAAPPPSSPANKTEDDWN